MSVDVNVRRLLAALPALSDEQVREIHRAAKAELGVRKKIRAPRRIHYCDGRGLYPSRPICGHPYYDVPTTTDEPTEVTCRRCIRIGPHLGLALGEAS